MLTSAVFLFFAVVVTKCHDNAVAIDTFTSMIGMSSIKLQPRSYSSIDLIIKSTRSASFVHAVDAIERTDIHDTDIDAHAASAITNMANVVGDATSNVANSDDRAIRALSRPTHWPGASRMFQLWGKVLLGAQRLLAWPS